MEGPRRAAAGAAYHRSAARRCVEEGRGGRRGDGGGGEGDRLLPRRGRRPRRERDPAARAVQITRGTQPYAGSPPRPLRPQFLAAATRVLGRLWVVRSRQGPRRRGGRSLALQPLPHKLRAGGAV